MFIRRHIMAPTNTTFASILVEFLHSDVCSKLKWSVKNLRFSKNVFEIIWIKNPYRHKWGYGAAHKRIKGLAKMYLKIVCWKIASQQRIRTEYFCFNFVHSFIRTTQWACATVPRQASEIANFAAKALFDDHVIYPYFLTRLGSTRGTGFQTHSQVCRAEGLNPWP